MTKKQLDTNTKKVICLKKIHNHVGKNKKLDIKWEALYKITKILGQGTASTQKQNSIGH